MVKQEQIARPAVTFPSERIRSTFPALHEKPRLVERRWDQTQAYCESKLYVTALAFAVARRWPDVLSNAVDPGWVPTKMGGAGASDDLEKGHLTQTWLAVSNDPAATISGGYWYHRQQRRPASEVSDSRFQGQLVTTLADLTGVSLF